MPKLLAHIDLNKNELRNAVIQPLASDPSTPSDGQIYYNTTSDTIKYYITGTGWATLGTGTGSGDASTNTATSVDSEIALFSGTSGKTLKRATTTGLLKGTSGVISAATEGTDYYGGGGTDVLVTDGGTGRSTGTTAYSLVATGTTATGAQQTLANGATTEILVGGGAAALPVWTTATGTGAPVRATSPTLVTPVLGTPTSVTLTNATGLPVSGITASTVTALGVGTVELGHATDTTLSRGAAGRLAVEGVNVVTATSTDTLTGKTIDANGSGNSITNLETADLASGVLNTSTSLATASDTQIPSALATKTYVDNSVQGLSWKQAVRVASTANITIASALTNASTIDGITVATGDRVLLKDQSTASQNGIYTVVASGAASRTADADTSAEIDSMTVYVEQGTANADTVWTLTTDNPTLGSTSLTYAQVNGGTVPTATTSTAGKVQLATTAETQAKTDTAKAVTPSGLTDFTRKYSATIGDGSTTAIAVTHSLGTKDVISQVRQVSDDAVVECDMVNTSTTVTTFTFAVAPASSAIRVVIQG